MRILLTNDDGIDAPGINVLADLLQGEGHDIHIVAPINEQSATSHSITLHEPLRVVERSRNRYAITGSPADCMILASRVILESPPDLVISGINGGQNMGEDILYSGTVAAALEAMFMGYRAMAVSIASHVNQHFDTAASFISTFLRAGLHDLIQGREIFNINIPNLRLEQIRGIRVTRTGHRHYQDFVKEQKDPRGRTIYWIGGARPLWDDVAGTDFKAVDEGYISITPLSPSFTREPSLDKVKRWADRINGEGSAR